MTATSGDTGKAAMAGFADVKDTQIIVFYPKDGVSELFSFEAQSNFLIGNPSFLAYHPAKMSPKFPVGTLKLTACPAEI